MAVTTVTGEKKAQATVTVTGKVKPTTKILER
jgi:hypothetical protein